MEVIEHEEGEARFDNNDSNIDLDKALSYIDTRLQNVLGHFQRDFEGFVSAETLGPKHGEYGSFLPTHKHPPTVHSHSKPPQNALNSYKPPSFDNFHSKDASSNSVKPAFQHRGVFVDQNGLSANDSTSKDTSKKETTTSNLGNPKKQRILKLRIKVGSDKITRKKYELYSVYGLNNTPSSSTGNDPEESGGPPIDSPSSILRDMTSIFVPENRLLSPLNESLLCLPKTVRKTESVDSKRGLTNDLKVKPASNSVQRPGVMLNADVSTSKANEAAKKLIPVKKRETKRDLIKDQLFGPDFSSEEESKVVKHVNDCQVDPKETTREPQEVKLPDNIDKFSSERKNNLMGVQSSSLSGPMKEKKSALKDIVKIRNSYKDILDTRVEDQNKQTKPPDMCTGNEAITEKNVERIGIPAEVAVPQITEVVPPVPPDNWVGCDRCQKWRILPIGIEPDNLPDKWLCSMLTWLPGRNRCDVSEEETTKAVQDMNLRLISQIQHSVEANIGHSVLTNLNAVSENMPNRLLKNKSRPECSNSSMIESSHSSMNAREKKRKSFSEANQPLVEKHVVNKPVTVKVNGKDVNGGDVRTKKLKRKTVSTQYETVPLNKIKTESESEQVYVSNGGHRPRDKLVISVKRKTDSKLLDKKEEMPAKKRKLKVREESQPCEDILESSEDKLGRKEKRLKTEVNESTDVKPLNIGKTMKIRLSSASKENSVNTSQKVLSAVTSSSSKVSGSCKRAASLQERKRSPVGSVSSFPIRPSTLHKISPAAGKTISSQSQIFADKAEVKHKTMIPQSSGKGSLSRSKDKDEKNNIQRVQIKTSDPLTGNKELFPNKMRKIENTLSESKLGDMGSSEVNPTVKIRDLKVLEPKMEDSFNQNAKRRVPDCGTMKDLSVTSFLKEYASSQTAMSAFKRAEQSKDYADRLKMSGFDYECNDAYFDSALKFLYTASLLEASSITDFSKSKGVDLINGYSISTKLSKVCAQEYEKRKEMTAATLAYKCIEVACMRIVYCKSLVTRQDLQTMQMVTQGESPSSSASDVDNLNNHASIDKTILSKSIGNQVVARNHTNFSRLLDFTSDVNLAMEACMKSQNAYKAANATLEETTNKEMIGLVKRVVDFSFHDVKELVCLVQNARETINRQGFKGGNSRQ